MPILNILMFIVSPIFAWIIHNYLTHGDMSGKRKVFFLGLYVVLMNTLVFGVSYKLKYIGLGCVLGFIVPFPICLLMEDKITIGGLRRYTKKFTNDFKRFIPYAIRSAKSDLNAEVRGSLLDWLWWMIEPLCTMLIYAVMFGIYYRDSSEYADVFDGNFL